MTDNIFDSMAKRYDTEDRKALADVIANEFRRELAGHEYHSMLDYGCGTGLVGLQLTDMFDRTTLADASDQMVQIVKTKITDEGLEHVEAIHLDLTREQADIEVDVIIISLVLIHVPEVEVLLSALYKTLNPGGRLLIIDFDKNHNVYHPKLHNGFAHEEMRGLLLEAGFTPSAVRTFHEGQQLFMKQDASMFITTGSK
ncbi:class I SAM-dependent methyltransferase [Salinicoccus sp. ID82-1]|uniref:class I SAM-dependent DNA methyltransferase n=1 Tax=Salinicoccus sp. ID82-1 TaxID=2820269 RepID=UPI001F3C9869|nr:class I SAM-dependent methyltransferase [Salinicoccus sp. ID82-1]MCG1010795.1 class I SAM-dependent methyltransferase [Salinicoccus sp. ID82-1]